MEHRVWLAGVGVTPLPRSWRGHQPVLPDVLGRFWLLQLPLGSSRRGDTFGRRPTIHGGYWRGGHTAGARSEHALKGHLRRLHILLHAHEPAAFFTLLLPTSHTGLCSRRFGHAKTDRSPRNRAIPTREGNLAALSHRHTIIALTLDINNFLKENFITIRDTAWR